MKIENAKIRTPSDSKTSAKSNHRTSVYNESYKGEYYNLDIKKLIPFKGQSRRYFDQDSLKEMAQTIASHGIRQPLTVIPSDEYEGKYEIVSGERRYRAAEIAGLSKVPCILIHDKTNAEEIALIENVQRKNLHPIELMKGLKNLLIKKICNTHQEISNKIGISRTVVVEILNLQNLPDETQELLINNSIKAREVLRKLLKSPPDEHKNIILDEINKRTKARKDVKKIPSTKNKILSVYLQDDRMMFDRPKNVKLTYEQQKELEKYISEMH